MNQPASGERRHDLDALRALAMLLGIGLHAALSFFAFPWPVQDSRQSLWFGLFFLAVHGFRMQLFFFVSGFFTAMLWRKRGLKALLMHRVQRILVPCLLGLVTVVPAFHWISLWALESGFDADRRDRLKRAAALPSAAAPADADAVDADAVDADAVDADAASQTSQARQLASLPSLESLRAAVVADPVGLRLDPKLAMTLLSWSALRGDLATVKLLVDQGIVRTPRPSQPGHAAAAGEPAGEPREVVAARGAGEAGSQATLPAPESLGGETASARRSWAEELVARYYAWISSPRFALRAADSSGKPPHQLFFSPVFHHLWFLWFLCWLVPLFAVYAAAADVFGWRGLPRPLVLSPLRFAWLLPLTLIPQWFMGFLVPLFGPDSSASILPQPHVLAYYGVFFFFGALYYDCDDVEGRVGRRWWLFLPLALLIALPAGLVIQHRLVAATAQVVYAWAMVFGMLGLFRRLLPRRQAALRYLSDASYWMYVAHLPLVVALQVGMRSWNVPSGLKFFAVCLLATLLLLLSYQTVVRYTLLGLLLNGPRAASARSAR